MWCYVISTIFLCNKKQIEEDRQLFLTSSCCISIVIHWSGIKIEYRDVIFYIQTFKTIYSWTKSSLSEISVKRILNCCWVASLACYSLLGNRANKVSFIHFIDWITTWNGRNIWKLIRLLQYVNFCRYLSRKKMWK